MQRDTAMKVPAKPIFQGGGGGGSIERDSA